MCIKRCTHYTPGKGSEISLMHSTSFNTSSKTVNLYPPEYYRKDLNAQKYRNQLSEQSQDITIKHTFITPLKPCNAYLHGETFLTLLFLSLKHVYCIFKRSKFTLSNY